MYYIYHIPNVKIGVSKHPKRRVREQGYSEYEILETHTDIDLVSKRETELQKKYNLIEKFVAVDYKHQVNNFQSKSPLAKKGRIWKDEWRKKLSESCMGREISEEQRKKLSKSVRKRYESKELRLKCGSPAELNPRAHFTNEQVKWIRKVYWSCKNKYIKSPKGKYRANELADMFNIKPFVIRRVALRKTYSSVV